MRQAALPLFALLAACGPATRTLVETPTPPPAVDSTLGVGDSIDVRVFGEADLSGTLRYRTTRSPVEIEQELTPLLLHFFNHQTHHRGQAHGILTHITGEAPSFDLLIYQRETGIGIRAGQGGDFSAPETRGS